MNDLAIALAAAYTQELEVFFHLDEWHFSGPFPHKIVVETREILASIRPTLLFLIEPYLGHETGLYYLSAYRIVDRPES